MISFSRATEYAEQLMMKEPTLLRDLRQVTTRELRYYDMLSGPVIGSFLNLMIRLSGARTVLEIGTFTGYASLWMAMALPTDGCVVTCESNEKYAGIARRFFDRFREEWSNPPEITLLPGPAMESALEAALPTGADFIFLDADKECYPDYYNRLFPLLVPGGLMVIDNAFWGGKVWEEGGVEGKTDAGTRGTLEGGAAGRTVKGARGMADAETGSVSATNAGDRKAQAIDRLNRIIAADPRVQNVVLTVRDGLHLVRKKKESHI